MGPSGAVATAVADSYDICMSSKKRLSASIEGELLQAAEDAVHRGDAASVSAWVNDALRFKVEHDLRLRALAELISAYEAEHGEITAEEMRAAARSARARAVVVRGRRSKAPRAPRSAASR